MIRALTTALLISAGAFGGLVLAASLADALVIWALLSACGLAVMIDEIRRLP